MDDIWKSIFKDFKVKTLLRLCQVNHEFFNYVHVLKIIQPYKFLIRDNRQFMKGNLLSWLTNEFNKQKHSIYQISYVQVIINNKISSYKFNTKEFDFEFTYNSCGVVEIENVDRFIMIDGSFFEVDYDGFETGLNYKHPLTYTELLSDLKLKY